MKFVVDGPSLNGYKLQRARGCQKAEAQEALPLGTLWLQPNQIRNLNYPQEQEVDNCEERKLSLTVK